MNDHTPSYSSAPGRSQPRSVALQRWGALAGGGALALYGITRRSAPGLAIAAAGGTLAYVGLRSNHRRRPLIAHSSVVVNLSPQDAYRFWRDLENLPLFMYHLESVTVLNEHESRWIARPYMNSRIFWNAEITAQREGELLAWRSLPDSELDLEARIEFREASGNRGTLVEARMQFWPRSGPMRQFVSRLLGTYPSFLMEQDLRRFKALVETGEIPTIEGQTHGPRDIATAVARVLNPDRPKKGDLQLKEAIAAQRRVS